MSLEESYQILGIKPGASFVEVRRSYRQLLKFFHPDRHQASPGLLRKATEETKKLNLAYERVCKILGSAPRAARSEKGATPKSSRARAAGPPPKQGEGYPIPSCAMKLNWVAPGRFIMGSPAGEAGRSEDEGPQTEVTIGFGFWLGVFTVTQEEWKAVAEDAGGLNPEPSYFHGDRLPVEQVSWEDCQRWLQQLNAMEQQGNRLPRNYHYRLPTEAEWEFACRAATQTAFNFGEGQAQLSDHAWYSGNSGSETHHVGQKAANAWGFHDMHGNVWEWCNDRYGGPLPGGSVTDPRGPVAGLNRVFRGGSWGVAAVRCRAAYRVWNKPAYRDFTLGFRVALGVTE